MMSLSASSLTLPHNIVDLNNRAVCSLSEGHHDDSVAAIGEALAKLEYYQSLERAATSKSNNTMFCSQDQSPQQQVFASCNDCRQSTPSAMQTDSAVSDHSSYISPICCVPLTAADELQQEINHSFTSRFAVFGRALTISNPQHLSSNYSRTMSMLLYNMGLTLHLKALHSGKSAELQGALDLYEMSFTVVEDNWSNFDIVDDLMILLLALFNNMGHIHSVLYNENQIQTCVQWLKGLAANPNFLKVMQRQEFAPFFLNLLVVLNQDQFCRCSPAA